MNDKPTILVIEDHHDIIEIVRYNLEREGYTILAAYDGAAGLQMAQQQKPHLILLDLMLPKMDGLEVCRRLRQQESTALIPIIMLTAKNAESDVVLGLGLGADDYVNKPFSPKELLARVKAVLRRSQTKTAVSDDEIITFGALRIDSKAYEVTLNKKPVSLTLAEFKLLRALAQQPGRVLSREQLLEKMVGSDVNVVDRNIDVHIAALRKKLKGFGNQITTVRGVGYRLADA